MNTDKQSFFEQKVTKETKVLFFVSFVSLCLHSLCAIPALAGVVREYFGQGKYDDGQRVWYARMYDGSVEATFDDSGKNLSASRYSVWSTYIRSWRNS